MMGEQNEQKYFFQLTQKLEKWQKFTDAQPT